jgi:hypothetical protein
MPSPDASREDNHFCDRKTHLPLQFGLSAGHINQAVANTNEVESRF